MSRRLLGVVAAAGMLIPSGAFAAANHSAPARPNPSLTPLSPDYVNPLSTEVAQLKQGVIAAALADQTYLTYEQTGDLGGFAPAPVGEFALTSGGRTIVGTAQANAQLPKYAQAAGGKQKSFAFVSGTTTPPPGTAKQAVPGLKPPTNTNTVPPPNQGFAGVTPATPSPPGTTTTAAGGTATTTGGAATTTGETTTQASSGFRTTTGSRATTTTATSSTATSGSTTTSTTPGSTTTSTTPSKTSPTKTPTHPITVRTTTTAPVAITTNPATTTTATTTPSAPASPPGTTTQPPVAPSGTSCGTTGLAVTSNLTTCNMAAYNMAPGGSVSEVLTIQNQSGGDVKLSLQASGLPNPLWNALELGVWQVGSAAPDPFPPLAWWAAQDNPVQTLTNDQTVQYEVELYLPSTAGNADQGLSVSLDLSWNAEGCDPSC